MKILIPICLFLPFLLFPLSAFSDELSKVDAANLLNRECGTIRKSASFTISPACSFEVLQVDNFGRGEATVAQIVVYSRGFTYDITFTVVFQLLWNDSGAYYPTIIEVREGRFMGISPLAEKILKDL